VNFDDASHISHLLIQSPVDIIFSLQVLSSCLIYRLSHIQSATSSLVVAQFVVELAGQAVLLLFKAGE
jgi:hypothetical protein